MSVEAKGWRLAGPLMLYCEDPKILPEAQKPGEMNNTVYSFWKWL